MSSIASFRFFPKKVFVSPQDLIARIPELKSIPQLLPTTYRFIDVRYSLANPLLHGISEFQKCSVKGAIFADLESDLCQLDSSRPGARHPLPPMDNFLTWCYKRDLLVPLLVSPSSSSNVVRPVVCYDDQGGGLAACRLWWMLRQLQLEVYVLEGGFQAYLAAGLPTQKGMDPGYTGVISPDETSPVENNVVNGRFIERDHMNGSNDDNKATIGVNQRFHQLEVAEGNFRVGFSFEELSVNAGGTTAGGFGTSPCTAIEETIDTRQKLFSNQLLIDEIPLGAKIVDARTGERFFSQCRPYLVDKVPGHMEGAVNHPWGSNFQPVEATLPTTGDELVVKKVNYVVLKPRNELRKHMLNTLLGSTTTSSVCGDEEGVENEVSIKNVVFMCGSGVTACVNIAVCQHLGFTGEPWLYDGSWSEYGTQFKWLILRSLVCKNHLCFTPIKADFTGAKLSHFSEKDLQEKLVVKMMDVSPSQLLLGSKVQQDWQQIKQNRNRNLFSLLPPVDAEASGSVSSSTASSPDGKHSNEKRVKWGEIQPRHLRQGIQKELHVGEVMLAQFIDDAGELGCVQVTPIMHE